MKPLTPFLLTMFATVAYAGNLTIALDHDVLSAVPGDTVTFSGMLTSLEADTIDLNSYSISLAGQFSADGTAFLLNAPFTLAGLASSENFGMFTVAVLVPYTDPGGLQSGTFTILGGVEGPGGYDESTQNVLGSTTFAVDVAAAPEPATISMAMLAGATAICWRLRSRRSNRGRSAISTICNI